MEAHTPKRYAVERFLERSAGHAQGWQVRVIDEQDDPLVRLEAVKKDSGAEPPRTLELHTRQVTLTHDDIDDLTKKMIVRWLDSLVHGAPAPQAH
ncbi:MAG: hypothetical protein JOZ62_15720 [Acidobacteriaceae bacterium]|nr:hypothetical protein [Acidobacteriaceae bacterium]